MFAPDYFAADYYAPDYFPPGDVITQIYLGSGKPVVYDLDKLLKKIKDEEIREETERLLKSKDVQIKQEKLIKGVNVDYTLPSPIVYEPIKDAKPLHDIKNEVDREIAKLLRVRELEIYSLIQRIHAEEVLRQEEELFILLMLL